MKHPLGLVSFFATAIVIFSTAVTAADAGAERLEINRDATKRTPISLVGYSGEAAAVLRFDLEIAGFLLTSEEKAAYVLKGDNEGQVRGLLTDVIAKSIRLNKGFAGGSTRSQAHALSDAVVEAITGQHGIASTKIAFKVHNGPNSEIYIYDYDAHNAKALTSDNTVVAAPCWVPHQRRLYYTTYVFGNADIVSHDLNSGARQVVARYSGSNLSPSASPDGRFLAMVLSKGGSPDIYVADADGSNARQLTRSREDESSPCWSPDGRTILFATKMNGRRVLATVPAAGGQVERLKIGAVVNPSEPDWSPDGKWIVFTAQMGGFHLYKVQAGGGDAEEICEGEDASWASNSRTLVFTRRSGGGKRGLSLLDVPTKEIKDVGQNLGVCSQPSWAR